MRDPELVARAERGARRLESAWERWRAQHGLANAPGQPIVSYVGYSLTEPWGEPRVVIGIDADEAEYLADFLDRDDGAHVQLPRQQAMMASPSPSPASPVLPGSLASSAPSAEGGDDYPAAALVGAPVSAGIGLQAQSHPQDMSTELPGWSPGERTDQTAEQLAGWQGGQAAADQPSIAT